MKCARCGNDYDVWYWDTKKERWDTLEDLGLCTPCKSVLFDLLHNIYWRSCIGGNLHIVVDDMNVEDEAIDWCFTVGIEQNKHEMDEGGLGMEREFLLTLRKMDEDARRRLIESFHSRKPS